MRLGYDDSLFSEPSFNPAWPAHYLPEHVVSRDHRALGRRGPARRRLRAGRRPVAVRRADLRGRPGRPRHHGGRRPDPRRRRRRARAGLASQSAPLREIAARVLEVSDNEGAEVLSHQVGQGGDRQRDVRRRGRGGHPDARRGSASPPTFDIHDGSGLSRENLITPLALVQVLPAGPRPRAPRARTPSPPRCRWPASPAR